MSSIPWPILLALMVLFLGFRIAVFFYKAYEDKRSITIYLSIRGATDIAISWRIADSTRDTYTYDVRYKNQAGQRRTTRCKIGGSYTENEIYWSESPEV